MDAEDGKESAASILADLEAPEEAPKGLKDEANLTVFVTWVLFGGLGKGISVMDAARMPAVMRADFMYLIGELSKARERRKHLEDAARAIA